MKFENTKWRTGAIIGLIFLVGLIIGLVLFSSSNPSQASTKQELLWKKYDNWMYKAMVAPDSRNTIDVTINYDKSSVSSLKSFVQTNKNLENKLKESGKTTFNGIITFNQPVSVVDFNTFATKNKLKLGSFTLRVLASNGNRWTIMGISEDGVTISSSKVAENLTTIQERDKQAILSGIVDADIEFKASQYQDLYLFKSVFLVDITPTLARQEVTTEMVKGDTYTLSFNLTRPYWNMEDLGLKNFQ